MPCRAQLSSSEKVSAEKTKIAPQALLRGVAQVSNADAGHLGNATVPCTGDGSTWNSIEEINSDKSIDRGRPSLALRSISCRSGVQEPEVGSSYVDRSSEHNSSLVVCSSSALEAKAENGLDPMILSLLQRSSLDADREHRNMMLKENGLDPMILSLLQRSSLDADREHHNSNPPVTDSNDVEDVLPNHISFSEELRLQGLGKWLQHCRVMLHHVAGTPERAWLLFSLIFILETVVVAIFRPKTIKLLNATHQQQRNQTGLGLQHQLPWYFGHCISYAVLASVLLGSAVSRHLSVTNPLAARRDALQSTVIRLREDAGHLGNATVPCTGDGSTWNSIEEINSDKSIDRGRPSLALRSSSCRSGVQEPEVGSSYVDRSLEHNSSLVVCSSSALEAKAVILVHPLLQTSRYWT
ncbi:Calpain-type cysteine protease DEK1 [Capsicum baccatum]|uniref:Calpain-type cysteine protease DEK1 n=1 Tax=Capsicum baccatum TaxID=33114 RepID=A0A2G2V7I3_CAPBA|nr:Calpain-type cysteine protease DEK1 [Capsicum baccatum]